MKLDDVYIQSVLPKMGMAHCLYCKYYVKYFVGLYLWTCCYIYNKVDIKINARVDLWEVQQLLS